MTGSNRILLVGRQQDLLDRTTRVLESVGCIVTGTVSDGTAIDLASSSDYDALLIADEVPQSDRQYVATLARNSKPSIAVVVVVDSETVLTQLRQVGLRL